MSPQASRAPERLAYTVNEFPAAAGIGRTLFYELVKSGELRTVTLRGRRLIPAEAATALFSQRA